jgi:hypothetical protein
MKCYAIFPTFDLKKDDAQSRACIEVVSRIVVEALRREAIASTSPWTGLTPAQDPTVVYTERTSLRRKFGSLKTLTPSMTAFEALLIQKAEWDRR